MKEEPLDLEGCQYINVTKENGELIASIPTHDKNGDIITKKGYTVVFGYEAEEEFHEGNDGKIYLSDEKNRRG